MKYFLSLLLIFSLCSCSNLCPQGKNVLNRHWINQHCVTIRSVVGVAKGFQCSLNLKDPIKVGHYKYHYNPSKGYYD